MSEIEILNYHQLAFVANAVYLLSFTGLIFITFRLVRFQRESNSNVFGKVLVTLFGHMSMFYLYQFYTVDKVLPFYSLFPIIGIILTFIIFLEIPGIYEIFGGFIIIGSVYLIHIENKKN